MAASFDSCTLVKTEKGSYAHSTTASPLVDLFFSGFVRGTDEEKLTKMLNNSWQCDPLMTLKMCFYARNCRGVGMGEKRTAYIAWEFLQQKFPKIWKKNLPNVEKFGSFKDLLMMTVRRLQHSNPGDLPELGYFSDCLRCDFDALSAGKSLSLAGKWAPRQKTHFDTFKVNDKSIRLPKKIAEMMWPKITNHSYLMMKYRKLCTDLNKRLKTVEPMMCDQDWANIRYSSVPSVCMKRNRKAFMKHDEERFTEYLASVKRGEQKINASVIQPHELVKACCNVSQVDEVIERQWEALRNKIKESCTLNKTLCVCDVSGSMTCNYNKGEIPIYVCLALGILTSEIVEPPFGNHIITFSERPTFHRIVGDNLRQKIENLKNAHWEMNTNLIATFEMILNRALQYGLTQEQMPTQLLIISDMQFDEAVGHQTTTHDVIREKYRQSGYQLPRIVYWNVAPNKIGFPINAACPDSLLVSGFSPSLLSCLVETGDINPLIFVKKVLGDSLFDSVTL